ncbi:MAG: S1 RNA-binding domain-containing protein [Succiniclasticum sp.]|jgi:S1 RNA binding domain protein
MAIEVGSVVEGEVTGITNFGAFLQLPEGKVGLVHISEVSNVYVKDVHDFLKEHQKVKVKVLSIDPNGKIGLSIKRLEPAPEASTKRPEGRPFRTERPGANERRFPNERRAARPQPAGPLSFEDKLSRFMKESDDRLLDLRRNTESKRGGRGASRAR